MSDWRIWRNGMSAALAGLLCLAGPGLAKGDDKPVSMHSFSGAFLAAQTAAADRDLDNAIAFYKRALEFDPDNIDLKQQLFLALLSAGKFEESLPVAEELKTTAAIERYSRVALATEALRVREYRQAANLLELALQNDLDRLLTGVMTGWAYQGSGDTAKALETVEGLDGPEWYDLFKELHLAFIADAAGDKAKAATYYAAMLEDRASAAAGPEAWLRGVEAYVVFLARSGDRDRAIEILDELGPTAESRIGLQDLRKRVLAGEAVKPVIQNAQQGAAEMLYGVATALSRPGSEDIVKIYLELARSLQPKSAEVLVQLAAVSESMDKAEDAIAYYEQVPDDSPLRHTAELQLGLNLADLDRNDEAKKYLKDILDDDPADRRAYLALGGVYASLKEYDQAATLYDQAVAAMGTPAEIDWNLFYQRGIAYERIKQWDKAEPNFRKALELFPDQPQVLNYLGYSWVDMNIKLDEGLDLIRKAVDLRPEDGYIVDSLGWAYYRLGRFDEAVDELERAVRLRPEDPTINDHLGDAYWRAGRRREAVFKWSTALDLKPDEEFIPDIQRKMKEGLPEPGTATAQKAEAVDKQQTESIVVANNGAADENAYVVLSGQSLWDIAAKVLGDGDRYTDILELNPVLQGDPDRIVPGQKLRMPSGAN